MPRNQTRLRPQSLVQSASTVLPPVRGINSSGALASMPPTDALQMDNLISSDLGLTVREGWSEYATNVGNASPLPVRTIMSYDGAPSTSTVPPLASSRLFAVTDNGIYNVEGGGNKSGVAPMIGLSGVTNAGLMQCVQFTNDAGQFLLACSETDGGYLYNGTTWMKMTSAGGPGPGIITGVDPATFAHVMVWKKRLMFTVRGSSRVWFLPVNAVGGAAQVFDFGPQLLNGGALVGLANWTQDDGAGIDDRLVILGSSGDLVVYAGTDPSSASAFQNLGTWYIGQPPVGRRSFTTTGGNVYVLSQYGVIPVNQIVQGGLDNILTSDTDLIAQLRKLQDQLNADFSTLLNTQGWELLALPNKAMLHIARPSVSVTDYVQYGFQLHNLAWSRFLDVPARTFARRLSEVYAGTDDGRVLRVFNGYSDGTKLDGTGAQEIRARLTPAFSYFGSPAGQKLITLMRCNFLSNVPPAYALAMNADFAITSQATSPIGTNAVGSLWDQAFWDQAFWAGANASFAEWRGVEGFGYALTPTIFISAQEKTILASIEYMVTGGGPL